MTPYQFAVHVCLFDAALDDEGELRSIRIGKRSLAARLGKGTRSSQGNLQHISEKLRELHDLGLIQLGESDRTGTVVRVNAPSDVSWVKEALGPKTRSEVIPDYFRDPTLRRQLFDRDKWRCRYCGVHVDETTATLDHIVPQTMGGDDNPGNLSTACHGCNSVKSGRAEADAAPLLLARLRDQAIRQQGTE